MEQLKKKGKQLASKYLLYDKDEETLDHLLLYYTKVYKL